MWNVAITSVTTKLLPASTKPMPEDIVLKMDPIVRLPMVLMIFDNQFTMSGNCKEPIKRKWTCYK